MISYISRDNLYILATMTIIRYALKPRFLEIEECARLVRLVPKKGIRPAEIIRKNRDEIRDYPWCLKRKRGHEERIRCILLSFYLQVDHPSRDDGVCPRGRSILRES